MTRHNAHRTAEAATSTHTFLTHVGDDIRTVGVVVQRLGHRATDLAGLDLELLARAAVGVPQAAARGKLVVVGSDGVAVHQTLPGAEPELAWCGNGTATVAQVIGVQRAAFDLFGPEGKVVRATQVSVGTGTKQNWRLAGFQVTEADWLGLPVWQCNGLNRYAVVCGPLPDGVAPEDARRALAGAGLAAKLMLLLATTSGPPHIEFYNSNGKHGAAPASGIATLSILTRLSPRIRTLTRDGAVSFDTKAGPVTTPLFDILIESAGSFSLVMPTVGVRLAPLVGCWQ